MGLHVLGLLHFDHFVVDLHEVVFVAVFIAGLLVVEFYDSFGEDCEGELEEFVVFFLLLSGCEATVNAHEFILYRTWEIKG